MVKPVLVCCTHDPSGDYIKPLKNVTHKLNNIYAEKFITVSDVSSKELITVLRGSNFNVKVIEKKGAAHARREAVKFGLESSGEYFHYCDFDRLLTWASNYFVELKSALEEIKKYNYLVLGRTKRAFLTHPIEWQATEKITNSICSIIFKKEIDITAGACGFSRESAEAIAKYSKAKMTDAEWPMIIYKIMGLEIDYKDVDGLEYVDDINSVRRAQSDEEKWISRLKLCQIICESALRIQQYEEFE